MGWTQNRIWFNCKQKISHCTNHSCSRGKKLYEITLRVLIILLSRTSLDKKKHTILSLNKLNSATLYEILIDANNIKPTSQTYFENLFLNFKPD